MVPPPEEEETPDEEEIPDEDDVPEDDEPVPADDEGLITLDVRCWSDVDR